MLEVRARPGPAKLAEGFVHFQNEPWQKLLPKAFQTSAEERHQQTQHKVAEATVPGTAVGFKTCINWEKVEWSSFVLNL